MQIILGGREQSDDLMSQMCEFFSRQAFSLRAPRNESLIEWALKVI